MFTWNKFTVVHSFSKCHYAPRHYIPPSLSLYLDRNSEINFYSLFTKRSISIFSWHLGPNTDAFDNSFYTFLSTKSDEPVDVIVPSPNQLSRYRIKFLIPLANAVIFYLEQNVMWSIIAKWSPSNFKWPVDDEAFARYGGQLKNPVIGQSGATRIFSKGGGVPSKV